MVPTNATASATNHERSIGELFGELATETSTLVRQEVKLAGTELSEKAAEVAKKSAIVGIGALLGMVSLLVLAAALVLGLGRVVPLWASALIVGGALAVVAFLVASAGLRALKNTQLRPVETLASMQENKRWMTKQIQ
jgi:cytochrome c biogenesis protein CcdA